MNGTTLYLANFASGCILKTANHIDNSHRGNGRAYVSHDRNVGQYQQRAAERPLWAAGRVAVGYLVVAGCLVVVGCLGVLAFELSGPLFGFGVRQERRCGCGNTTTQYNRAFEY